MTIAVGLPVAVLAAGIPDSWNPVLYFPHPKGITGHRGISHWLLTGAVLTWLLYAKIGIGLDLSVFFAAGFASHLVLDAFTGGGFYALGPIPIKIGVYWIENGSRAEDVVRYLLIALCVVIGVMVAGQYIH